jgi:hypothetical protein
MNAILSVAVISKCFNIAPLLKNLFASFVTLYLESAKNVSLKVRSHGNLTKDKEFGLA